LALKVAYKDDNLGLGASLKPANPEHNRTGLDAFQGLLGRLNSKDEAEVKKFEQRTEGRKLAMWTQGRWGGVTFVPGGLLVQGDKFRKAEDDASLEESPAGEPVVNSEPGAARKEAKALRKAERQERRETKLKKRATSNVAGSAGDTTKKATDSFHENAEDKQRLESHMGSAQSAVGVDTKIILTTGGKGKRRKTTSDKDKRQPIAAYHTMEDVEEREIVIDTIQLPTPPLECLETRAPTPVIQSSSMNGRHLIRGRNIQAKRMAFADTKMLDEVRHCEPFLGEDC
jgi:Pin2-interacting protein X1